MNTHCMINFFYQQVESQSLTLIITNSQQKPCHDIRRLHGFLILEFLNGPISVE